MAAVSVAVAGRVPGVICVPGRSPRRSASVWADPDRTSAGDPRGPSNAAAGGSSE